MSDVPLQRRLDVIEGRWGAEAESAARARDGTGLRRAADALERCGAIRADLDRLSRDVAALEDALRGGVESVPTPDDHPPSSRDSNARAHAILQRTKALESLEAAGVRLRRLTEAVFEAPSGTRIAVPFSAELEPDKWWLGSYLGRFDEVLLLCEAGEDLLMFHLDLRWIESNVHGLSRDAKGNVKFNVERSGSTFYLRIGGGQTIELTPFVPSRDASRLGRRL